MFAFFANVGREYSYLAISLLYLSSRAPHNDEPRSRGEYNSMGLLLFWMARRSDRRHKPGAPISRALCEKWDFRHLPLDVAAASVPQIPNITTGLLARHAKHSALKPNT
jgi:hypothetical protein